MAASVFGRDIALVLAPKVALVVAILNTTIGFELDSDRHARERPADTHNIS
jgi:hypothetical protein